jgi:hypothetical protein
MRGTKKRQPHHGAGLEVVGLSAAKPSEDHRRDGKRWSGLVAKADGLKAEEIHTIEVPRARPDQGDGRDSMISET